MPESLYVVSYLQSHYIEVAQGAIFMEKICMRFVMKVQENHEP